MKGFTATSLLLAAVAQADTRPASPIAKVIEMLAALQAKIIGEGKESQTSYDSFAEWCEDTAKNLQFEIKTGTNNIAELKATIEFETAEAEKLAAKVDKLASTIATAEADLKAATDIRTQEAKDFAAADKELVEVVDTIGRAIGILEKEASGGAAMMQLKEAGGVVQALSIMVKASMLDAADGNRLAALLQSKQTSDDAADDQEDGAGAPAAAVYENQSGGIVDVLSGLQEDAQKQLDDARKKETNAKQNFDMLKQSLVDQIKFANEDTAAAKKGIAESGESKATATGDLDISTKDLITDQKALADLHHNCMSKAEEFELGTKARGEELNALATAKKIINEAMASAAMVQVNTPESFLQVSSSASSEAVRIVKELAKSQNSHMLAQLASRMTSMARLSNSNGDDPFAKVKGLISDMIEKLENEADASATEKAYCDKELGESNAKKDDLTNDIEKLTGRIDQATAHSTKLKGEVATLQKELADLAKSVSEWQKFRAEEKEVFDKEKAETEKGLAGIKTALQVLRDYYASAGDGAAQGAGGGIVSLLEVCESDFSKALSEMISTEEEAVQVFEAEMHDSEMEKTGKEQDVKYKTKEHVGLDKAVAANSKDRSGIQTELDAVNEYLTQLEGRCVAKAETYASKVKRRNAEIAGLKEALEVLGGAGAASLLQKAHSHALRGVRRH
jgi:peptidoglycan hydrolase CwlO-like protein